MPSAVSGQAYPLRVPRSPALERRFPAARQRIPRWLSGGDGNRRRRRAPDPAPAVLARVVPVLALLVLVLGWRRCAAPAAREAPSALPQGESAAAARDAAGAPGAPRAAAIDPALQALVERLIDRDNGTTAVAVRHLRTGASAAYHEQDVFPAASLAKVPVLVEVARRLETGAVRPDDPVRITPDAITGGAGVLQARAGEELAVVELMRLAVTVSDNVAARLLLRHVGGVEAVNRTLAALGLEQTRLYADDRPNTTTAAEMAALLAGLAARAETAPTRAGAPAPAAGTLAALLALPQAQAWLAQGVPRGVPVAHKSGQLPNLRHDAGVVYAPRGPYVLVVLTDDLSDQDAAEAFVARLSRAVYEHFRSA